jgi:serine/threonine-protein kinase HipA
MMYHPVEHIEVLCWGNKVGAIALDPSSGCYAFEYYPDFQKTDIELAPLSVPLDTRSARVFPNLPTQTYQRLPAFVADSLPDDFGNNLVNAWMERQGIPRNQITPLDRLAYVGKRGMGALEFRPILHNETTRPSILEVEQLVQEARKAVSADFEKESHADLDAELSQLISVGTSAGGARAKAVVGYNPRTEQFISGQFKVSQGYEHWLIKFDVSSPTDLGVSQEYGRIEYAYYLMALESGITIQKSRLFEKAKRAHFMTKRFDREDDNTRHHIQTLCAMAQMDYHALRVHDYSQLFMTARDLDLPLESHDEIFRRMVFNVAMSNRDDHTKNHAFMLKKDSRWELSPAYDITHARGMGPDAWTTQHIMGVDGVFDNITREAVLRVGRRFHVRNPEHIVDTIIEVASRWPEFARQAGLSNAERNRVGNDIKTYSELLRK